MGGAGRKGWRVGERWQAGRERQEETAKKKKKRERKQAATAQHTQGNSEARKWAV